MMTETLNMVMNMRSNELAKSIPGEDHEQAPVKNGAVYVKPQTRLQGA